VSFAEGRAFVVSLQEAGLSPSSVAGFVRGLRAFSAWCAADGRVAEDPLRRAATPDSPCNRTGLLGVVITWLERTGRHDARACSLQLTETPLEEVRPMNAVSMWVLPLAVTVGRLP
jgi:hypothetical protein